MTDDPHSSTQAILPRFLAEENEAIGDLLLVLGLSGRVMPMALNDHVAELDESLQVLLASELDEADRRQLSGLLLHFVGRLLIERHDGIWIVPNDPVSVHYGQLTIGAMRDTPPGTTIDPALMAKDLLAGTRLTEVLDRVDGEIDGLPR